MFVGQPNQCGQPIRDVYHSLLDLISLGHLLALNISANPDEGRTSDSAFPRIRILALKRLVVASDRNHTSVVGSEAQYGVLPDAEILEFIYQSFDGSVYLKHHGTLHFAVVVGHVRTLLDEGLVSLQRIVRSCERKHDESWLISWFLRQCINSFICEEFSGVIARILFWISFFYLSESIEKV